MTCSNGRYELLCSRSGDPELDEAVDAAGIELDGTTCACVTDEQHAKEVPFDDSYCSSNFDSDDPDRHEKAHVIVNDICGWTTP
jgi:hypothetical protein